MSDNSDIFFSILGPLAAWSGGEEVKLSTRRSRVALALLIVEQGKYVDSAYILDCLYGERLPKNSANQLHRGISELRIQGVPIETKQSSYKLSSPLDSVDSHQFTVLCESADSAMRDGRFQEASDLYSQALALWRGSALSGLEGDGLSVYSDFWNEKRLAAEELRIDAEMACGRAHQLIPKIQILCSENPLHERLKGQLMIALYRAGRLSESLKVYIDLKEDLRNSLGVDPPAQIDDIYLGILRNDSDITLW